MDLRDHCLTMHRYQRWAYGRLFEAVRTLEEREYRRDVGLFFGSVHRSLNHLLLVDRIWLGRLEGHPAPYTSLDQEIESDREVLETELYAQCERWHAFVASAPRERFDATETYTSLLGKPFVLPFVEVVLHVPNHGAHHRGQISAALTQFGIDAPVMDLPFFLVQPG